MVELIRQDSIWGIKDVCSTKRFTSLNNQTNKQVNKQANKQTNKLTNTLTERAMLRNYLMSDGSAVRRSPTDAMLFFEALEVEVGWPGRRVKQGGHAVRDHSLSNPIRCSDEFLFDATWPDLQMVLWVSFIQRPSTGACAVRMTTCPPQWVQRILQHKKNQYKK